MTRTQHLSVKLLSYPRSIVFSVMLSIVTAYGFLVFASLSIVIWAQDSKRDDNDHAVVVYQSGDALHGYFLIERLQGLGLPQIHYSEALYLDLAERLYLPITKSSEATDLEDLPEFPQLSDKEYREKFFQVVIENAQHIGSQFIKEKFFVKDHIFSGGHGEVWRAYKFTESGDVETASSFILKRMKTKSLRRIEICAKREIFFGNFFNEYHDEISTTRFAHSFEDQESTWLVFAEEGMSLQSLLYTTTMTESIALLEPSIFWQRMRSTKEGSLFMKKILFGIIEAISKLHEIDIVHRDLKPGNILINTEKNFRIVVGDFSSAFYPFFEESNQTTQFAISELTEEYSAPEVSLFSEFCDPIKNGKTSNNESYFLSKLGLDASYEKSYDVWSVGVVFLELILGTSHVFNIENEKKRAKITQDVRKKFRKQRNRFDQSKTGRELPSARNSCHSVFYDVTEDQLVEKYLLLNSLHEYGFLSDSQAAMFFQEFVDENASTHSEKTSQRKAIEKSKNSHHDSSSNIEESAMLALSDSETDNKIDEAVVSMSANSDKLFETHKSNSTRNQTTTDNSTENGMTRFEKLSNAILARDRLKLGYTDEWGLDLLSRMLNFHPSGRISLHDALQHAYFHGPYQSRYDKSLFATLFERNKYDETQAHVPHNDEVTATKMVKLYAQQESVKQIHLSESNGLVVVSQVCYETSPALNDDDDVLMNNVCVNTHTEVGALVLSDSSRSLVEIQPYTSALVSVPLESKKNKMTSSLDL